MNLKETDRDVDCRRKYRVYSYMFIKNLQASKMYESPIIPIGHFSSYKLLEKFDFRHTVLCYG